MVQGLSFGFLSTMRVILARWLLDVSGADISVIFINVSADVTIISCVTYSKLKGGCDYLLISVVSSPQ